MRVIDADALIENRYLVNNYGDIVGKRYYVTFNEIKAMPIIKPRKGKWIAVTKTYKVIKDKKYKYIIEWTPTYDPDEFEAFKCSECGEVFEIKDARNWCSQCGANMSI